MSITDYIFIVGLVTGLIVLIILVILDNYQGKMLHHIDKIHKALEHQNKINEAVHKSLEYHQEALSKITERMKKN